MAGYASSEAMNAADVAARIQAAQIGASGGIEQARIGAMGGYAQQQLQTGGAVAMSNAQIAGDLQRAQGGDRNAALRLQAELGLQSQLANNQDRMRIAQLASSTGLRDALAARGYVRGMGPQPEYGSAWLGSSISPVTCSA